jgi:hypothetical protein
LYVCVFRFLYLFKVVSFLLPPVFHRRIIKKPNLAAEAGRDGFSAFTSYARGDMGGVLSSAMGLVKAATGNAQKAEQISKAT